MSPTLMEVNSWTQAFESNRANNINLPTARYLIGTPLLGDYLSEGLAQFGYSCEEIADEHPAG